jgi:hypothetical protein
MNLILKIWLWKGDKDTKFKRLNDYANWTSKYCRFLYKDYCKNLPNIIKQIKGQKHES